MISSSQSSYVPQIIPVADVPPSRTRQTAVAVAASLWIPAVAASMAYPLALRVFVASIHAAQDGVGATRLLWSLGALVMSTVAIAPALLALRGLYASRLGTDPGTVAVRRLLHLVVAVPPVYLLWIRVAGGMNSLIGNADSGLITWGVLWIALGALVWNAGRRPLPETFDSSASASSPGPWREESSSGQRPVSLPSVLTGRARKVHRLAVVAVLVSFLVLHLTNHLFALWSVPAQRMVMLALRTWYRAIWMEPVILTLFVVAALTGLLRFGRITRGQSNGFAVLQTASGVYLAFFLMSHIWATLGARFHGIDTDWAFASGGKAGMLAAGVSAGVLLYYVFSLLAVGVHAGLGLRMVLLSRRVRAVAANRAARLTFAFGSAVSALIVAALLGVRLAG